MSDDIFKKLLDAGIIAKSAKSIYHFADDPEKASINHFSEWDLAGALMEIVAAEVESIDIGTYEQGIVGARSRIPKFWCEIRELAFIRDDSLPRAITLACVEALKEKDDE